MGFDATLVKPVHQAQLHNALVGVPNHTSETVQSDVRPADAASTLDGISILLVEDNSVNQRVATRILARFGCAVVTAGNGKQALESLANGSFDLVLMDCQMPVMDGFEATREIRRGEVGTKRHQPVLAMTAGVMEGDRDKCLAAGMDGYVAKPVKPQELLQAILPWVGRTVQATAGPVSAPPNPAFEVLESERLNEACGDDAEFLAEVVAEYVGGVDQQLDKILHAIEQHDCTALASLAHSLKGSTRTIGGMAAAAVCEELEICARQNVEAGLQGIYERALDAFVELKEALKHFELRDAA